MKKLTYLLVVSSLFCLKGALANEADMKDLIPAEEMDQIVSEDVTALNDNANEDSSDTALNADLVGRRPGWGGGPGRPGNGPGGPGWGGGPGRPGWGGGPGRPGWGGGPGRPGWGGGWGPGRPGWGGGWGPGRPGWGGGWGPGRGVTCYARDAYGQVYAATAFSAQAAQSQAMNACYSSSNSNCYAQGCR